MQLVAQGAGVTLLPALAVPAEVGRAGLSTRPLAAPVARRTLAVVWRRRSPLGPDLRRLAAVVRVACRTSQAVGGEAAAAPHRRSGRPSRTLPGR